MDFYINGFRFEKTCDECPEQYDVFDPAGNMVAYFRLRNGYFRVQCPDVGGTTVYNAATNGDGIFDADERVKYLREAILAVEAHYINVSAEQLD